MVSTQTTQAMNPSVYKSLPYHPVDSFAAVTGIRRGALVVLARKDLGLASLKDLIARAKAEPGKLTFGSGNGSSRAGGEYFKLLAQVDMLHVPYKSQPQAMTDIAGGRLDLTWTDMYTGLPFIKDGRARALAVTSGQRLATLPDVPTHSEAGVPGYELWAWTAVFAPAGTPRPIVDRLNALFRAAIETPSFREQSAQVRRGAVSGIAGGSGSVPARRDREVGADHQGGGDAGTVRRGHRRLGQALSARPNTPRLG